MQNSTNNVRKKYMVKLQGFSDKTYKFRCQENNQGKFGDSFEIELDSKYFEGLGFDEVKDVVQDYLNGEEIHEPDGVETAVDTVEKNHFSFMQSPKLKNVALAGVGCVAFIFGITLAVGFDGGATNASDIEYNDMFVKEYARMPPEEKVAYLETKIKQLRTERESVYGNCKAMCEADRQTYDGVVTQLKGEKSMLGLTIQEEAIARQHQKKK